LIGSWRRNIASRDRSRRDAMRHGDDRQPFAGQPRQDRRGPRSGSPASVDVIHSIQATHDVDGQIQRQIEG